MMLSSDRPAARDFAAKIAGELLPGVDDQPPRVLVVDDDEANRDSLARRLQRRGMTVDLANDGQAALSAIESGEHPFDLVVLDVMMPGLSGLEVLTRVRERHTAAELPIIMATAKDQSEDVVEAFKLGASDYVTKPLDFAVVLARVQTQLSLRRSVARVLALEKYLSDRNAELETANTRLRDAAERTEREMQLAAKIQATYLPRDESPQLHQVEFAWRYEPSAQLAGDALNMFALDSEHVAFYLLDVSGHGVAASLTAVAAARMLSAPGEPDSILCNRAGDGQPRSPSEVVGLLNERFAFNADTGQFLTCVYGIIHTPSRTLTYVCAGHPGPLLVCPNGGTRALETTGLPVGIGDAYEQRVETLACGSRLFLYSDGITESRCPNGTFFGDERLAAAVESGRTLTLRESVTQIEKCVSSFRRDLPAADDVSLLALECG